MLDSMIRSVAAGGHGQSHRVTAPATGRAEKPWRWLCVPRPLLFVGCHGIGAGSNQSLHRHTMGSGNNQNRTDGHGRVRRTILTAAPPVHHWERRTSGRTETQTGREATDARLRTCCPSCTHSDDSDSDSDDSDSDRDTALASALCAISSRSVCLFACRCRRPARVDAPPAATPSIVRPR